MASPKPYVDRIIVKGASNAWQPSWAVAGVQTLKSFLRLSGCVSVGVAEFGSERFGSFYLTVCHFVSSSRMPQQCQDTLGNVSEM